MSHSRVRFNMRTRCRELLLLLVVCALASSEPLNRTTKKETAESLQYDDFDSEDGILFSEDKPCPRDCICNVSQGYKIARCSRLEIGTQKFGDDITDVVIENADPRFPIDLDDYTFKKLGLHQISTLKIVNSTIGSISSKAFHGLHDLYAVNLSGNKLKTLHPETFANNKKLLLLTLPNNPLQFPKGEYFLNASSVQELDISNCNMKYITANTFKYMPALMYLNVAGNHIYDMDPDVFKKLLDLEELDLSDNDIKSLPVDIFSDNTELATLHIQKNPIDSVYGLQISDLLTLNAGQTHIKFVGPSMFNGMKYIANLNLSGNGIEKIHNQAFHKLVELNYLDLSYNNLDFISNILIKENIELEIFKISNNQKLKHLPKDGFICSADQFNIYYFDASNCGLEEIYDNSLSTFTVLTQINLSGNAIKTINRQVFEPLTRIVEINLADNQLTSLDNKVFAKNKELGKLILRGNPLKAISAEVFLSTPALRSLDVSHAHLTSLWKDDKNRPTTFLNSLNYLNISFNRINIVKQNELQTLNKLRTLDITNNPLVCNVDFENLITWLNNKTILPSTSSVSIANLARDAKDESATYSWEFLVLQTCGAKTTSEATAVSDEEIWERLDKDDEDNFDLKDTLDDAKIADNNNLNDDILKPINDVVDNDDKENIDDDDDGEDDEEEDDAADDYDDDVEMKVDIEKPKEVSEPTPLLKENVPSVQVDVKLLDNDSLYDDLEPEVYEPVSVIQAEHGRYEYLWPIVIALLVAILLMIVIAKVVLVMCRRNRQIRYNSAIIAAMAQSGRTKKDCGLIYQPLSEDLAGPTTPKFNRYQPLPTVAVQASNMSYESSPFHHNNIVPEAV